MSSSKDSVFSVPVATLGVPRIGRSRELKCALEGSWSGKCAVDDLLFESFGCTPVDTCLADTNNDGILSPADFSAWVAAFNAMDLACDQNADEACTPADFSAWVANFNAGCP